MLVLQGRLSTASSLLTMIDEFRMDEQRLTQTFNIMSSYIYGEYALPLSNIKIWEPYFPIFAQKMYEYGSPFPNLIGILDGIL